MMPKIKDQSYFAQVLDPVSYWSDYENCNFSYCESRPGTFLSGKFINCKFVGAKLIRARIGAQARFTNCDFTGAIFTGSTFYRARFDGCKMDQADFLDCDGLGFAEFDAHCSYVGIKGASHKFTSASGHHLELIKKSKEPIIVAKYPSQYGEYEDEYSEFWGMGYGVYLPRDLKAVLIVSDEKELAGDKGDVPTSEQ